MSRPELVASLPVPEIENPAAIISFAFRGGDVVRLVEQEEARLADGGDPSTSLMDLSLLYQLVGERSHAMACQAGALSKHRIFRNKHPQQAPALRLLVFVTLGDLSTNTPIDLLIDEQEIEVTRLFVLPGQEKPEQVPEHDVAMVAIGEGDGTLEILAKLENWLQDWPRPVINKPAAIRDLARDRLFRKLSDAPSIVIPDTWRISADQLKAGGHPFPVIVRPVDSHAGRGLEKLDDASDIGPYMARNPSAEYYVSHYVDYSSPDGHYRKYRIAFFNGEAHLCHMAIGDHWMVHYLNAGMDESPVKRQEEAVAMGRFDEQVGARQAAAFAALRDRLGLDYFMIDCAEAQDGRLLVFEASIIGIVHAMEPENVYPYKRPHMKGVFSAFGRFLHRAAAKA